MKQPICEMCEGTSFIKEGDFFVCQACGMKYPAAELKKLMREEAEPKAESLPVQQAPDTRLLDKHIANARRAKDREDWEDAERYYNKAEEIDPDNTEAVFYSSYSKLMLRLKENNDYFKREATAEVLINNMALIQDTYTANDATELQTYNNAIVQLIYSSFVYNSLDNQKYKTNALFERILASWKNTLHEIMVKEPNFENRKKLFYPILNSSLFDVSKWLEKLNIPEMPKRAFISNIELAKDVYTENDIEEICNLNNSTIKNISKIGIDFISIVEAWKDFLYKIAQTSKDENKRKQILLLYFQQVSTICHLKAKDLTTYSKNANPQLLFEEPECNYYISKEEVYSYTPYEQVVEREENKDIYQWLCENDKEFSLSELKNATNLIKNIEAKVQSLLKGTKMLFDVISCAIAIVAFALLFSSITTDEIVLGILSCVVCAALAYGAQNIKKSITIESQYPHFATLLKYRNNLVNIYTTHFAEDAKNHPEIMKADFVDKQV